jgi:hypothetical protein
MKHTARRRGIYFYSWVNLIRQLRKLEAKIKQVLYPLNLSETSEAEVRHELVSNPAKCSVYARHAKVIKEIVRDLQQDDKLDELAAGFESAILKHWQNELNIYLKERPSERRVIWFTDVIGNTGKTWMSRYLLATLRENCIRLENSKSDNIKYAYNGERVVIFDYSRSQADHVNYEVIESVKNGIMFSGKYESCSKTFDIPHVVIFANFEPDLTKLSADRWDVRHFTEDDLKKTNRMSRDIDNKVETAIVIDSSSDEPEVIDITETEVINETTELYNKSSGSKFSSFGPTPFPGVYNVKDYQIFNSTLGRLVPTCDKAMSNLLGSKPGIVRAYIIILFSYMPVITIYS